jgi:hypothetical protein
MVDIGIVTGISPIFSKGQHVATAVLHDKFLVDNKLLLCCNENRFILRCMLKS